MAFTLIQAGEALQLLDTSGALATLDLPALGTGGAPSFVATPFLSQFVRPRFAVFGQYVVMVNSPTRPITIDGNGVVSLLTPLAPTTPVTLSGVTAGGLSGTYQVKQTFYIRDAGGNLIAESGYGPLATAVTISAKKLRVTGISISPDPVSGTRLYRTTNGGTTYFLWMEIEGNTQTQIEDDLSDAGLSLIEGPVLGNAPDLTLVVNYKGRLFGVDRIAVDNLRYTETGIAYAWSAANDQPVAPTGQDSRGITGLIARRNALGIGRRDKLRQLTGTSPLDFEIVELSENVGIESNETIMIVNDVAYWLWKDGVYRWDADGLTCVSNGVAGKGNVRSWFNTNSYFNKAQFHQAFAVILPDRFVYRLFLCSAGSLVIDRFVDYDITEGTWWGPHQTSAFTPTCALVRGNSDGIAAATVGSSSGFLWQEQAVRTDDTSAPIDFNVDTTGQDSAEPTIEKVFGATRIANNPQTSGRLLVTPSVGEVNAMAASQALALDLREGNSRIGHIGRGKTVSLNFREATAGQNVELLGYEIEVAALGRR